MLVEPQLIYRAREGDEAAFNHLVGAYRNRMFGVISRLIGRPEDVEDVAQEVFVRVYYSLGQLRSTELFEPWLYRLTTNACYDYLRRAKRRRESRMADFSEQQVMMADSATATQVEAEERRNRETRDTVNTLFENVSEQDRLLLTLKEVEGLSLKELEQIYGVRENALKVRLFRARQRMLRAYTDAKADGKV
jgi:RNA polymerase sigma-70 factor (ECF subfamily)